MRTLADLLTSVQTLATQGNLNTVITGLTLYADKATPGDVFMTVRGLTRDGHQFIRQAIERGAVAAIGDRPPDELVHQGWLPPDFPYVQVQDGRGAPAQVAAAFYGYPGRQLRVVGVTGTDGKTTTSNLIYSVLKAAGFKVGAVTTVSAMIGDQELDTGFHTTTPDAPEVQRYLAQMVAAGMEVAVLETTSHGLDQKRVDAIDFDVAVVTNITHEHLDAHGFSLHAYQQAKALLFRKLSQSPAKPGLPKTAVLNADDGSFEYLEPIPAERKLRYGVLAPHPLVPSPTQGRGATETPSLPVWQRATEGEGLDVYATDILTTSRGLQFTAHTPVGAFQVTSPLLGVYNVHNILAALCVGVAFGVAPEAMPAGIAEVRGILGRMDPVDEGQPFLAVVDFAHTPNALAQALRAGREMLSSVAAGLADNPPSSAPDGFAIHPSDYKSDGSGGETGSGGEATRQGQGRVIVVFGSAGLRDREKRRMMGEVAGQLADIVIVTAEDPRTESLDSIIAESAAAAQAQGKVEGVDLFRIADRGEAIYRATQMAEPGDIVLACGKGHEQSMCFGTIEYPWSDHAALRSALRGAPLRTLPTSHQKPE